MRSRHSTIQSTDFHALEHLAAKKEFKKIFIFLKLAESWPGSGGQYVPAAWKDFPRERRET
jgi:hypothetical protein